MRPPYLTSSASPIVLAPDPLLFTVRGLERLRERLASAAPFPLAVIVGAPLPHALALTWDLPCPALVICPVGQPRYGVAIDLYGQAADWLPGVGPRVCIIGPDRRLHAVQAEAALPETDLK